jgi:xanthine dehydrogenase YagR molybdenum-binding subunit
MDYITPIDHTPLDDHPQGVVGQPIDRFEGRLKVTGRAPYAAEYAGQGKAAYGYLVQSAIAKGRITDIDTAAAERSPGVLTVLTYRNANPPQGQKAKTSEGPVAGKKGVPQLRDDVIDHSGQPIALVVAESFEEARAAAALVRATYDRQPAAAELQPRLAFGEIPKEREPDSFVGDFDAAFAAAPVTVDAIWTTPTQSHAMMEPHATIAQWDGDQLTLHTSHQMISPGAGSVAATLNIPKDKVRMVSRYIGGGFGGKLDVWADCILAALASRKLGGRPVKVVLARPQIFEVAGHRPRTIQHVRLGAEPDGRLTAIGHDVWCDNNPNETFYETAALATRSLYAGANRRTTHRLVPLGIPTGCSMRAPGEAVGLLALECAMDELAEKLNLDPIELRVRNEPSEDPEKHIPYSSRNLIPCMRTGARLFGWERRQARPGQVSDGRWRVGIGMAAATRDVVFLPSQAKVTLSPDGTLAVRMAMTDIGTGTYTILAQLASELTGVPLAKVNVLIGDTDFPPAPGSGGSFGAISSGSGLYDACETLRAMLCRAAGLEPQGVRFQDGRLIAGNAAHDLGDLCRGQPIEALGEIKPGGLAKQYSQQSYGAHFAEVGVDRDTGEIRLRRMLGVFTAGRILNEKTARSQCLGGMTMGVGAALMEDLTLDPRFAAYVNHDLAEYHVPVHADAPNIEVVLLPELDDKASPLKAKGIGELGICGAGAAVANAVYNACGVRIRDYPLTLDKVLPGLKAA